jgi:ankyrin repeat protein
MTYAIQLEGTIAFDSAEDVAEARDAFRHATGYAPEEIDGVALAPDTHTYRLAAHLEGSSEEILSAQGAFLTLSGSSSDSSFRSTVTTGDADPAGGDARTSGESWVHDDEVLVAVRHDRPEEVREVARGALDAVEPETGRTLLHVAAEAGAAAVAEMLLQDGVEVDRRRRRDITALHDAAGADVVEVLVEGGAALDARDLHGETPLVHAGERGDEEVVLALLARGASIPSASDARWLAQHAALENMPRVPAVLVEHGFTLEELGGDELVDRALHAGHAEVVVALRDLGVELPSKALRVACTTGSVPLVEAILEAQPDAATEAMQVVDHPDAPIAVAANAGHLDVVQYLHERGAPLVPATLGETTPLHQAAYRDRRELVRWMIEERDVDPNLLNQYEETPLHAAGIGDHVTCAKLLVELGTDPSRRDSWDETVFEKLSDAAASKLKNWLAERD